MALVGLIESHRVIGYTHIYFVSVPDTYQTGRKGTVCDYECTNSRLFVVSFRIRSQTAAIHQSKCHTLEKKNEFDTSLLLFFLSLSRFSPFTQKMERREEEERK